MKIYRTRPQLVFTIDNWFSSTGWALGSTTVCPVPYITFRLHRVTCLLPATQAESHAGSKVYIWNVFGEDSCCRTRLLLLLLPSPPRRATSPWPGTPSPAFPHPLTLSTLTGTVIMSLIFGMVSESWLMVCDSIGWYRMVNDSWWIVSVRFLRVWDEFSWLVAASFQEFFSAGDYSDWLVWFSYLFLLHTDPDQ